MKFIESTRGAMLAIKYDATPIEDAIPIDFEVLPVIVPINNEICGMASFTSLGVPKELLAGKRPSAGED